MRVAIQHEDAELWSQRIGPDDHLEFAPTGVGAIQRRLGSLKVADAMAEGQREKR